MPPKAATGADEDVKFLLTVIKQMTGAINWQAVTDELSLPSKGAAAKRYSRLPAKYNIAAPGKASSATPDVEEDAPKTPKKSKAKAAPKKATAASKKRKVQEDEEADDAGDDVKAEDDDE